MQTAAACYACIRLKDEKNVFKSNIWIRTLRSLICRAQTMKNTPIRKSEKKYFFKHENWTNHNRIKTNKNRTEYYGFRLFWLCL